MKTKPLIRNIFSIILIVVVPFVNGQNNKIIPVEQFFGNPYKSDFKISPDGKYLSYLAEKKNRLNIFLQETNSMVPVCLTHAKKRDIFEYYWVNDSTIVYLMDNAGDENTRLYGINIFTGKEQCYTPFKNVMTYINNVLEQSPDEIIIELNKNDPDQFLPFRLNLKSGELTLLAEDQSNVLEWFFDETGELRIIMKREGVEDIILCRENLHMSFDTLLVLPFYDSFEPCCFIDEGLFYAKSNIGRDKKALVKFDVRSKSEEVVFAHPEYDIEYIRYSYKNKQLNYIGYYADKSEKEFYNPAYQNIYNKLEQKLKGFEISLSDMTTDEEQFIVSTYNDKSFGGYYYYNSRKDTLIHLADDMPWLDEKDMAAMQPVSYVARDGLTIHAYLTLPKDRDRNLPIVVLVHGGPWERDKWVFNQDVQFLANRGYGVLQLNYRGSTGYGKSFYKASFKQWGLSMQDDITDGVYWLIEQGIADSTRIAIWGASYGGYAALSGVAFTPGLYQCAIDEVGPVNLFTYYENYPPHWELYRNQEYIEIGNPETDSLLLIRMSPYFHADKIKVPVLIAQGGNDPRVPKSESEQMVEVLKKNDVPVKYIYKANEGHGFTNVENRMELYHEIELFLETYLMKRED